MAVPLYTSHARRASPLLLTFTYLERSQKFTMKIKLCVYFILENHNRNNFFRSLLSVSVLTWRKYINFNARHRAHTYIYRYAREYTTPTQAQAQAQNKRRKKNLFMLLWEMLLSVRQIYNLQNIILCYWKSSHKIDPYRLFY